jgi:hypothetical protein
MTEINPNNINYFKNQTTTNPNTGNKTSLHDDVVKNFDGVIYPIEKNGANLLEDTSLGKNYGNWAVEDKGAAESEKLLAQYYTENGMYIPEINQEHVIQNTYIHCDNSKTNCFL